MKRQATADVEKRHNLAQLRHSLGDYLHIPILDCGLHTYVFRELRIGQNGGLRAAPTNRGVHPHMNTIGKKVLYVALSCLVALVVAGSVRADECSGALPAGSATGCGAVLDVTAVNGSGAATSFTATNTGNGNPYDGNEDTLIGIDNNSGATLDSITLNATDNTWGGLGNLDGDGPCSYNASDCYGLSGYEGPGTGFSGPCTGMYGCDTITVNFTGGLASGSTDWFALEGTPDSLTGSGGIVGVTTTPEPSTLLLFGAGLVGLGILMRRNATA